jgi:hypothetical protein
MNKIEKEEGVGVYSATIVSSPKGNRVKSQITRLIKLVQHWLSRWIVGENKSV